MKKRDPSLHIRESHLAIILQEVLCKLPIENKSFPKLARAILESAKTYSVPSRSVYVSNEKLLKKSEKLKLSTRSDAGLFSSILLQVRRKYSHRGIEIIKPGDKNWLEIKEICNLATEFCNEFGISKKEGYKEYCLIGMQKMKNYSLLKFKMLHPVIMKHYEAVVEIRQDNSPEQTIRAMREYSTQVSKRVGYLPSGKTEPEKQVCFIKAKEEAAKLGMELPDYIESQFVGLEWAKAIPDPYQLYGEKAVQRALRYCYENDIKLGKQKKAFINFKKIQGAGKHNTK